MLTNPTPEALRDLLFLGLYWRRLKGGLTPSKLPCQAVTIFGGMRSAGVISERIRYPLASNTRLISLVTLDIEKAPSSSGLTNTLSYSAKPLVVIVPGGAALNFNLVLGARGYRMALSDVGMTRAEAMVAMYRSHITQERFYEGFDGFLRQVAATSAPLNLDRGNKDA